MVRGIIFLLVAVGPAVIVAGLDAAGLMMAAVGDHPRWPNTHLNLSEAAAVRDQAEVVRLIEGGDTPNARRPVRPGLLGNDVQIQATPLEAAMSERRTEIMGLLFERGASLTPADWLRLRCAAQAREYGDVVATLDARRPDQVAIACSGDESFW